MNYLLSSCVVIPSKSWLTEDLDRGFCISQYTQFNLYCPLHCERIWELKFTIRKQIENLT